MKNGRKALMTFRPFCLSGMLSHYEDAERTPSPLPRAIWKAFPSGRRDAAMPDVCAWETHPKPHVPRRSRPFDMSNLCLCIAASY